LKRWVIFALIGILVFALGCEKKEPIKIGFSAQLTGKQAELGVQERNGVELAFDEVNKAGGIAGRPIVLVIKDDLGTPAGAINADKELIAENVVCIIGHPTSAQTLAALPTAEAGKTILMSPTTSTSALSGKDDGFFRIIQSLVDRARGLAEYVFKVQKAQKLTVIYDSENQAYVQSFWVQFSNRYKELGGAVVAEKAFSSSKEDVDFDKLVADARASQADALLIVAADTDTALIAQRVRIGGWNVPLYTSEWAQTDVLLKNGGNAVEGMVYEQSIAMGSKGKAFTDFKNAFTARYGREPAFGAVFGYETAKVLAKALEQSKGNKEGLKQGLLGIKDFQGLVDKMSIDQYGDVIRPYYLGKIEKGVFVDMDPKILK